MGEYSTMMVMRGDALAAIERKLERSGGITDEQLSEVMFALFGEERGANFSIVKQYSPEDWNWKE